MSYFRSDNVHIFPSTNRQAKWENSEIEYDYDSKFNSEYNFINILNSIVDFDSYVIGIINEVNPYSQGDLEVPTLYVVIHGYFFKIYNFDITSSSNKNLILSIKVNKNSKALISYNSNNTTLDNSSYFYGLLNTQNVTDISMPGKNDDYNVYTLKVSDDDGLINTIKFLPRNVEYNSSKSIAKEFNNKQHTLVANSGLLLNNNTLSVDRRDDSNNKVEFISDLAKAGNKSNFMYIDTLGRAFTTDISAGTKFISGSGYYMTRGTYTEKDSRNVSPIKNGTGFYYSTKTPDKITITSNDVKKPQNGDFWFVY